MTKKVDIAKTLTLGEMLEMVQLVGDVEITNECNETLLIASMVDLNVCALTKVLDKELLERQLLSYGSIDGRTMFKVAGMEDAE